MAIVESKLYHGTLKFDPAGSIKDWSCQVRNCRITPTHNKGDSVETLCGDLTLPVPTSTWVIQGTIVSDFAAESSGSIVRWALAQHGTDHDFELLPNNSSGTDKITGTCRVVALELGGDVNSRIEVDFSFDMDDEPTYVAVA